MDGSADITLVLPEPPSANRLFREISIAGKPRRVRTSEYNRWREAATAAVAQQSAADRIEGTYRLRLTVPKQRQRDLSNNIKATEDLLQLAGVVKNDLACELITVRRDLSREPGHLLVELWAS
ncbi:RusA family crossover junction endodeoxyribonuclease [Roseomonas nepalensis]|uniref:RusA family crossover junction endodeoxyribonuclease n=1 Tax=Muricoccus nepalensis TaxID=1854500 RepID=A0A502FUY2_9PROT|nr:RusA family crossover junction endodeoxyribonuclease [Roseomonas nepalensis]TPG53254.1 RusA family crossover junction endodeoxyribonuclease [Roseomonas nepalensis]